MSVKPIHQVLLEAFPQLGNVRQAFVDARDALVALKDLAPDAAPSIDAKVAMLNERIATLDTVIDSTDLAQLASTAVAELAAITRVGLTGRAHPGDVTGG